MKKLALPFCAFLLSSTLAFAGSGWHRVADLDAGGGGKEVAVKRECSVCLIKVTEGTVIINTIVVREGAKKDSIAVGARIEADNHQEIDLGGKRNVSGLRIGDDGKGHYEVYVK